MNLRKSDIILMALSSGIIVANIYYCQPLIVLIANEFSLSKTTAGIVTYLTQGGYALGLLFLVPLGDRIERKKQIVWTTFIAVISLLIAGIAPSFLVLCIASVLIGFTSVVPQLILPLSANLARPEERGKVIGIVMSGLLIGILLSRTLSGAVGAAMGWRAMFFVAALICLLLLVMINKRFPTSQPSFKGDYLDLMQSLWHLLKTQSILREASIINALAFAIFGMFWTSMVIFLSDDPSYRYTADQIGLFGLAGATGALAAPLVGKISDTKNPRIAIGYGLVIISISIFVFYFGGTHLALFVLAIILLDLGQQGTHVSNQTRVYTLIPEARNRLNTVFMTFSFIGVSCGSALGLELWKWNKWQGVCLGMGVLVVIAFTIYSLTYKKSIVKVSSV